MNNSEFYIVRDEEYLEHHGIKGQKWGIRRYQNPDGSLTKEGMLRYAKYYKDKQDENLQKSLFKEDGDPKDWKDNETRNQALERAFDKLEEKRKENDLSYKQMVSDIKAGKDISNKILNKKDFLNTVQKEDAIRSARTKKILKNVVPLTAAGSTFIARKIATGDFIPGGFGVEKGVKGIHWIKDIGKSTAIALAAGGLGYVTIDSIYEIKNKEVNTNGAT